MRLFVFILLSSFSLDAQAQLKIEFWKTIPRGANVSSGLSNKDQADGVKSKIRIVRLGAVGDPSDFRYLVKGTNPNDSWDKSSLALNKVVESVRTFTNKGYFVVLTFSHIPGRNWYFRKRDYRIWESQEYQNQLLSFWKQIVVSLKNNPNIVGYEPLNEPYTRNGDDEALNNFYKKFVSEIRLIDSETPIILDSNGMASYKLVKNLPIFKPVDNIIYSFHYYEPFPFWSAQVNQGKYAYPGAIPEEVGEASNTWNKEKHRLNLMSVRDWAQGHHILPYQIFVGEFGAWRKATGAMNYLRDVTGLFDEFGWPWTYYAYRESEWGNADLELLSNGKRINTPLYNLLKSQFR